MQKSGGEWGVGVTEELKTNVISAAAQKMQAGVLLCKVCSAACFNQLLTQNGICMARIHRHPKCLT